MRNPADDRFTLNVTQNVDSKMVWRLDGGRGMDGLHFDWKSSKMKMKNTVAGLVVVVVDDGGGDCVSKSDLPLAQSIEQCRCHTFPTASGSADTQPLLCCHRTYQFNQPLNTKSIIMFSFMRIHVYNCAVRGQNEDKRGLRYVSTRTKTERRTNKRKKKKNKKKITERNNVRLK